MGTQWSRKRTRSETLNMRIDPKLKYLAEIKARFEGKSLSHLIEGAMREYLRDPSWTPSESTSHASVPLPELSPLWQEGLWDEDEATRLFLLAVTDATLLKPAQQRLWTLLSGSILHNKRELSLSTFREYYNSPEIDKAHLDADESE